MKRQNLLDRGSTACRDDNNITMSIMITSLEEFDAFFAYEINNAMFACQTTRPGIAIKVFEWFWPANPFERISQDSFHKRQNAKGYLAIRLNPIVQVCAKFWMKTASRIIISAQPLGASHQGIERVLYQFLLDLALLPVVSHFWVN